MGAVPVRFVLYRNNEPMAAIHTSLEDARESAKEFLENKDALVIKNVNSPGTIQKWSYDHNVESWFELKY